MFVFWVNKKLIVRTTMCVISHCVCTTVYYLTSVEGHERHSLIAVCVFCFVKGMQNIISLGSEFKFLWWLVTQNISLYMHSYMFIYALTHVYICTHTCLDMYSYIFIHVYLFPFFVLFLKTRVSKVFCDH